MSQTITLVGVPGFGERTATIQFTLPDDEDCQLLPGTYTAAVTAVLTDIETETNLELVETWCESDFDCGCTDVPDEPAVVFPYSGEPTFGAVVGFELYSNAPGDGISAIEIHFDDGVRLLVDPEGFAAMFDETITRALYRCGTPVTYSSLFAEGDDDE